MLYFIWDFVFVSYKGRDFEFVAFLLLDTVVLFISGACVDRQKIYMKIKDGCNFEHYEQEIHSTNIYP